MIVTLSSSVIEADWLVIAAVVFNLWFVIGAAILIVISKD